MAEPLKNFFGPEVPQQIAATIAAVHPSFNAEAFVKDAVRGLSKLELLPRGWHIAEALHKHLPADFVEGAAILRRSLGARLPATEGNGMTSFLYLPHVFYASKYGIGHLDAALDLQYELTKRFSAEFSIRAFLDRYPDATLARLRVWARDEDVHVRRLVSEGTRPRLPWAPRLRAFQKDPAPVIELLELLKDDPELYVRRSVANNLNDIGKDHPEILFEVCRRWQKDASPERLWVIRHALRSSVKRGEPGALQVLGYGQAPTASIAKVSFKPKRARIGESVTVAFELKNEAKRSQALLVDVRVFFVKARGGTSAKVFKLRELRLGGGESQPLSLKIGLRQMTTRKHYPGAHRVEVVVNGVALPAGSFTLVE